MGGAAGGLGWKRKEYIIQGSINCRDKKLGFSFLLFYF
jgi:hypothetical protein